MTLFGTTRDGRHVNAIHLNAHGLSVSLLTYGAILQDVRLAGVPYSLTLGSDQIADYEADMLYHGSVVGPVANRISGATALIDGQTHQLDRNLNGTDMLHGGSAGTHNRIWNIDNQSEAEATLSLDMPNGEAGFPANRRITAHFQVLPQATLRLTLTTTSDAPSIANATNHSYWNLDGTDHMRDHKVRIDAEYYLGTTDQAFPTGKVLDVSQTPFDFRSVKRLTPKDPILDTTLCVAPDRRNLTECFKLWGASGVTMTVATTEPSVHLYDGAAAPRPGKPAYEGLAIEAQGWPDAPSHEHFPSILVSPNEPMIQVTQWQFARVEQPAN